MSNRCSICRPQQAQEINAAITCGEPERTIADHYDISGTVHRHKDCILKAAVEARKVRAVVSAATASDELARQRHRARKMEQAIDSWLTDPDDPESFTLAPRASEIPVVYIETRSDGKPKRKKSMLSKLLASFEQQLGVTVSYADTSGVADARRLFVDLLRAVNSQLELLAKLTAEFQPQRHRRLAYPSGTIRSGDCDARVWL